MTQFPRRPLPTGGHGVQCGGKECGWPQCQDNRQHSRQGSQAQINLITVGQGHRRWERPSRGGRGRWRGRLGLDEPLQVVDPAHVHLIGIKWSNVILGPRMAGGHRHTGKEVADEGPRAKQPCRSLDHCAANIGKEGPNGQNVKCWTRFFPTDDSVPSPLREIVPCPTGCPENREV